MDHFDLASSFRLTTYASWWIRQAMDRSTMNTTMTIRLPVHLHPIMQTIKQHEAGENEVSLNNYDAEQFAVVRRAMQAVHSLDALLLLPNTTNDSTSTEERAIRPVFLGEIATILEQVLTEREMRVLSLRYGLQNHEEHTLEQVGALEHVTRERVRQIKQGAFAKLQRSSFVESLLGV